MKKIAFTKPSRGTNASERRTITSGNRVFRFDCERCRLTRGAVDWSNKKVAFTLAEVLITLGIIGVVAALTIPSLIQHHRNQVVETRLKKVYSVVNQALVLAELDYGSREYWYNLNDVDFDKNGNPVSGDSLREKWLQKYLAPYIKTVKIKTLKNNSYDRPAIYFADGSVLTLSHGSRLSDWTFYPGEPIKCDKKYKYWFLAEGKCNFLFVGMFEVYDYGWDGTRDFLEKTCIKGKSGPDTSVRSTAYCTKLIQYNGWKIPKNYPYKVSY